VFFFYAFFFVFAFGVLVVKFFLFFEVVGIPLVLAERGLGDVARIEDDVGLGGGFKLGVA
jgi:hypothetical protein